VRGEATATCKTSISGGAYDVSLGLWKGMCGALIASTLPTSPAHSHACVFRVREGGVPDCIRHGRSSVLALPTPFNDDKAGCQVHHGLRLRGGLLRTHHSTNRHLSEGQPGARAGGAGAGAGRKLLRPSRLSAQLLQRRPLHSGRSLPESTPRLVRLRGDWLWRRDLRTSRVHLLRQTSARREQTMLGPLLQQRPLP